MLAFNKNRSSLVGSLAAAASIALILFVATACQSTKKDAKGPESVGSDVRLAELRQVVQTRVLDPGRSAALLNLTAQAERELGVINESYLEFSEEFGKMSADHSKSAADLETGLREWDSQASVRRGRIVDMMLAMRAQSTPAEWPAISDAFVNSVMRQSDRYRSLRPANS